MIVKTKQFAVKPMTPEEAVLQLELIGHDFFVFQNADTNDVNVVYRRRDGNYGLIEPQLTCQWPDEPTSATRGPSAGSRAASPASRGRASGTPRPSWTWTRCEATTLSRSSSGSAATGRSSATCRPTRSRPLTAELEARAAVHGARRASRRDAPGPWRALARPVRARRPAGRRSRPSRSRSAVPPRRRARCSSPTARSSTEPRRARGPGVRRARAAGRARFQAFVARADRVEDGRWELTVDPL